VRQSDTSGQKKGNYLLVPFFFVFFSSPIQQSQMSVNESNPYCFSIEAEFEEANIVFHTVSQ
jgi:hypothetical protein